MISAGPRHFNFLRTYDPATGRYLEAEPLGVDGELADAVIGFNGSAIRPPARGVLGQGDGIDRALQVFAFASAADPATPRPDLTSFAYAAGKPVTQTDSMGLRADPFPRLRQFEGLRKTIRRLGWWMGGGSWGTSGPPLPPMGDLPIECEPNERDARCWQIYDDEIQICNQFSNWLIRKNCYRRALDRRNACSKGLPQSEWPPLTLYPQ